jgi:hypothetical protein
VGGFDSSGVAVDVIEEIIPQGPVTGVKENDLAPSAFSLSQNYPNPFNPSTVISYQLPVNSETRLEIYNLSGQRVRTLVSGARPAGRHQAVWDGRDDGGRAVAGGTYFCRLQVGGFVRQRKLALVK